MEIMECGICKVKLPPFVGHENYLIKCKLCFDEHEVIVGFTGFEDKIVYVAYPKPKEVE